jgi:hypothetical protein
MKARPVAQRANCIGEHALIERRTFNREGTAQPFPLWRQVSGLHLRTIRARFQNANSRLWFPRS